MALIIKSLPQNFNSYQQMWDQFASDSTKEQFPDGVKIINLVNNAIVADYSKTNDGEQSIKNIVNIIGWYDSNPESKTHLINYLIELYNFIDNNSDSNRIFSYWWGLIDGITNTMHKTYSDLASRLSNIASSGKSGDIKSLNNKWWFIGGGAVVLLIIIIMIVRNKRRR
jgi:hypothetical protein